MGGKIKANESRIDKFKLPTSRIEAKILLDSANNLYQILSSKYRKVEE